MLFNIITLFPEIFDSVFSSSIIKRAIVTKTLKLNLVNPRDFATDKHKTVDDKPYGGGMGMVMKVDILASALESIRPKPYSILLSASGKTFTQKNALIFSKKSSIAIICGHYEGVDARVEKLVGETISIGDFVLTGGEIAAMAIIDSTTRLLPGVIKKESADLESFSPLTFNDSPFTLLEYPQYTRPEEFRGQTVPKILLSGNHSQIEKWRREQSIKRTRKFRPDLLNK